MKFLSIICILLSIFSCSQKQNQFESVENFNIRGFKFRTSKEDIRKHETLDFIEEGNVFSTIEVLAYKENFFGIKTRLQYDFYENSLVSVGYYLNFENITFSDILKKFKIIEHDLAKIYGDPHFNGFKTHQSRNAKIIDRNLSDSDIYEKLASRECIFIMEWRFEKQVTIQLIIGAGAKLETLTYTLAYIDPNCELYKDF